VIYQSKTAGTLRLIVAITTCRDEKEGPDEMYSDIEGNSASLASKVTAVSNSIHINRGGVL